jgi:hypothetical protein
MGGGGKPDGRHPSPESARGKLFAGKHPHLVCREQNNLHILSFVNFKESKRICTRDDGFGT